SIPMAKTAGKTGKVYCLDIQQKMLEKLKKRAKRNHVEQIIEPCLIDDNFTIRDLQNQIDFALLFAVVHEVSDKQKLFDDISGTLKSNRKIVFAEPSGHVSKKEFEESVKLAEKAGMLRLQKLKIHRSHAVLLCKE
ncbi:MAG: methyltransferase domain-containing protein, partial [Bacteroidales bacterium]|nr:methyltransferase domain-containing protein [Bacteroidales bacterium]